MRCKANWMTSKSGLKQTNKFNKCVFIQENVFRLHVAVSMSPKTSTPTCQPKEMTPGQTVPPAFFQQFEGMDLPL